MTPEQKQHAKRLMLEAIKDQGKLSARVFATVTALAVRSQYPAVTSGEMALLAWELLDEGKITGTTKGRHD